MVSKGQSRLGLAGRRIAEILAKFSALGLAAKADLLRAAYELALARVRLGTRSPETYLLSRGQIEEAASSAGLLPAQREHVERVALAIVRLVANVPWRSDCLVQALAANRWLATQGIASQICIGARMGEGQKLKAHAWLKVGQIFVTGGDGSDFTEFLLPD